MDKVPFPYPVVIIKDRIKNKDVFTASTPMFDIASQGDSVEEAKRELNEAVELFLEEPGVPIHVSVSEVFCSTGFAELPKDRIAGKKVPCSC